MSVEKFAQKLFVHDHWKIGVMQKKTDNIVSCIHNEMHDIHWLSAEAGHYYADPFIIEERGLLYLFFEDYTYNTNSAGLAYVTFNGTSFSQKTNILEALFHQSYPYIFRDNNQIYCLPEESANGKLSLYRATQFPHKWIKEKSLLKLPCVDATITQHEGKWWLFCTLAGKNVNEDLSIYYADTLLGKWNEHSNNPVKSNVRSSRPAGNLFLRNNSLYRPAQDCSQTYGGDTVINRIIHLSPTEFSEKQVSNIGLLEKDTFGTHTLSISENYIAFDVKKRASVREVIAKYQSYVEHSRS